MNEHASEPLTPLALGAGEDCPAHGEVGGGEHPARTAW